MSNNKKYKNKKIGDHELKPETMMMSYGYDPELSEGSVKPPIFLTSTFAYQTPEEGEEFFQVMAGKRSGPEGSVGGLIYSRFNHPNLEIIEDRLSLFEGSERTVVCSSGMGAISSILLAYLRPGDVIEVREKSKALEAITDSVKSNSSVYEWLEFSSDSLKGTFVAVPERSQIPENIKEQLIVELYSK